MLNDPIFITGCARSGTSMTAGVINYCGAFGGQVAGATKNNRKGMFENNAIRELIVKPILRKHKFDPMGQNPLPDIPGFPQRATRRSVETQRRYRKGYEATRIERWNSMVL